MSGVVVVKHAAQIPEAQPPERANNAQTFYFEEYLWTAGALVRALRFLLAKLFLVVLVLVLGVPMVPPPPLAAAELSVAGDPLMKHRYRARRGRGYGHHLDVRHVFKPMRFGEFQGEYRRSSAETTQILPSVLLFRK